MYAPEDKNGFEIEKRFRSSIIALWYVKGSIVHLCSNPLLHTLLHALAYMKFQPVGSAMTENNPARTDYHTPGEIEDHLAVEGEAAESLLSELAISLDTVLVNRHP